LRRVEFGESFPGAARRETLEESGCAVGDLALTGAYEMRNARVWGQGAYHLTMFAFLADARVALPASATADRGVGEVVHGVRQLLS